MSTLLAAGTGTVTVSVEPFSDYTAETGAPAYGASQDISAAVRRKDENIRLRDGSTVEVNLTLWVDAGQSPLPQKRDRLTLSGDTYIVEFTDRVTDLEGTLDHVKALCRDA